MKKTFISFILSFILISLAHGQFLYVHQSSGKDSFNIMDIDSITFHKGEVQQPEITRFVGGDISMLPQYEAHGNTYYDINGKKIDDVLSYFKELGQNSMRVRLFVDPTNASTEDKASGVVQDLKYVIQLGKRIKQQGLQFMLDFHYSDSWADPAKQTTPVSWRNASSKELCDTLYNYTKRCLSVLNQNGATPDFIQIGNEISYGMLWNTGKVYATSANNWDVFSNFLKSASKACREVCPKAKIIIHTERSGNASVSQQYYQRIKDNNIDYDIIGLSYYPLWHNDIATLSNTLSTLERSFPERTIQIVETAYNYQWYPDDATYDFRNVWPITPDGQKKFLADLITELKKHPNVNGLYWWFPEENGNGVIGNWLNRGLFDDNNGKALPALYILSDFLNE